MVKMEQWGNQKQEELGGVLFCTVVKCKYANGGRIPAGARLPLHSMLDLWVAMLVARGHLGGFGLVRGLASWLDGVTFTVAAHRRTQPMAGNGQHQAVPRHPNHCPSVLCSGCTDLALARAQDKARQPQDSHGATTGQSNHNRRAPLPVSRGCISTACSGIRRLPVLPSATCSTLSGIMTPPPEVPPRYPLPLTYT